jgi:uncharacterized RDD family membrane protein YckC
MADMMQPETLAAARHTLEPMAEPERGSDEEFAEWYVWAKREISTDNRVCQGAAQAAMEVLEESGDRVAAVAAARRSQAGHSMMLAGRVAPLRRSYAEWYDWVRRETGGEPGMLHRATRAAIQRLREGGSSQEAAAAARSLMGASGASSPAMAPVHHRPEPALEQPVAFAHPPVPGWTGRVGGETAPPQPPARYAGFWRRSLALLIDLVLVLLGCVVIGFLILILLAIALLSNGGTALGSDPTVSLIGIAILFVFVLTWLYFAGLESSPWQATVGKRATRLLVTDRMGRRLSFGRATGRFYAKALSTLPLLIGYFVAAFTPRKQALHDLIADTLVVRRSRPMGAPVPLPHHEAPDRASPGSEVQRI